MMQPLQNGETEAYQVDLVTNLFSILLIFLLTYIAAYSVEVTPNQSDYAKKEAVTNDFNLLRQRFFRPFTDLFILTPTGFYQLQLDTIADRLANLDRDDFMFLPEEKEQNRFVKSLFQTDHRDLDSFNLSYDLDIASLDTNPQLDRVSIDAQQFLSFLEENTYGHNKIAEFHVHQTELSKFAIISDSLTKRGYKFKFHLFNTKTKIGFYRDYAMFRSRTMER